MNITSEVWCDTCHKAYPRDSAHAWLQGKYIPPVLFEPESYWSEEDWDDLGRVVDGWEE